LDEVRKRLIAPKVNMSSVDMLNPDEGGAIGEEEHLRKGLNRLLGFVVQLEVGGGDFLDVVVVVGGWQVIVVMAGCSKGSGRVEVDMSRVISPHGGESFGFSDGTGDFDTSIDAESGSNKLDILSPSTPAAVASLSSLSSSSRALRSGRGAKRILRELGMELLRAPDRGGVIWPPPLVTDWRRELEEKDSFVLLPDEQEEKEERELFEAAFDMSLVGGDKEGEAGRGLMRMPGLVPERERGWGEWHGERNS
jgi:hypothetical protein